MTALSAIGSFFIIFLRDKLVFVVYQWLDLGACSASDEWDESGWEKTVGSIVSRTDFGEDKGEKGNEGKGRGRLVKKGEVVKFGMIMSRKEHELLESRCAVLKAISQGLELAKKGDVEPEDSFSRRWRKGSSR